MKITILGSQWEIIDKASETDYPSLKDADGYCDFYAKQIVLGEFTTANGYEYADLESFRRKVLRHELVHAFLHESGMTQLARNEEVSLTVIVRDGEIPSWATDAIVLPKIDF